ncbi:AAA family ATPase [Thiovibrio sp. JS02]
MRIKQLELTAFGPFTSQVLHFSLQSPGLHIIYGANEAGKSSTLRALKAWLFGFPERTADNFHHANDQLMVAGTLLAENGRELYFARRKRRKADLLDAAGKPLPPEALAAFLPIREQAIFDTLHAINHDDLVKGGEDILAQQGDVGQALFAAGAGLSSLRAVLNELEAEAEALFKVRGSKQEINTALARYHELQRQERLASLSAREWLELHTALSEAEENLDEIEKKKSAKERQLQQLTRLRHALPQLALRKDLQEKIAAVGKVVLLPEDFAKRRQGLENQLHSLTEKLNVAQSRLKSLKEKQAAIHLPQPTLDLEENIEALHQGLGSYKKALEDRPRLEGRRSGAKRDAGEFLVQVRADLTLAQVESLRPLLARAKVISTMASKHEGLMNALEDGRKALGAFEQARQSLDNALSSLPAGKETRHLAEAVHLARKTGEIDQQIAEKERLCGERRLNCEQEIKRLVLWQDTIADLLQLPLPMEKTVLHHEGLFAEAAGRRATLIAEKEQVLHQLGSVRTELSRFSTAGAVPSEEELLRLREHRDRGWSLVRRQWLAAEDVGEESRAYNPELSLADAFARDITEADALADRLRHEAERVHAYGALKAEEERLTSLQGELLSKEEQIAREFAALEENWQSIWAPCRVSPLTPKEMLFWLGSVEKIRGKAEELSRIEQELALLSQARQQRLDALLAELKRIGEPAAADGSELTPVLLHAEEALASLLEIRAKREQHLEKKRLREEEYSLLLAKQKEREAALSQWRREWRELTSGLAGEGRDLYPAEALDLLDNLHNCFARLKEAGEFAKRIEGIDQDSSRFLAAVKALAEKLAPEIIDQPAEQIVVQLKSRLNQARNDRVLLAGYAGAISEGEEEVIGLSGELESLKTQLQELCRQAGCSQPAELEGAEQLSGQCRELRKRLIETETTLIAGAGGLSLAQLTEEANQCEPDSLPERINALRREIDEELVPQSKRLSELIGEKRTRLEQMDGNARAAEAAEEAALLLARIRRLADRYLKLKLAAHALKGEIERYRSENQDPVITLSSKYFRLMTLGAYSGLRSDENDRGEPILIGLKGESIRVQIGQMSDGTRDQLYLALRLASLEWRRKNHEPVPFIADDILINFDDARARATLAILASLADSQQILLFTHHRRIVEEARSLVDAGCVQIHALTALETA